MAFWGECLHIYMPSLGLRLCWNFLVLELLHHLARFKLACLKSIVSPSCCALQRRKEKVLVQFIHSWSSFKQLFPVIWIPFSFIKCVIAIKKGGCSKVEICLFSRVSSDDEGKWPQVALEIRNHLFTISVMRHLNRLPRKVFLQETCRNKTQ